MNVGYHDVTRELDGYRCKHNYCVDTKRARSRGGKRCFQIMSEDNRIEVILAASLNHHARYFDNRKDVSGAELGGRPCKQARSIGTHYFQQITFVSEDTRFYVQNCRGPTEPVVGRSKRSHSATACVSLPFIGLKPNP